jgi:hypothetical protein
MSKKIKFLIILILIIALIGILSGVRAIKNVIVLNNAISKLEENLEKDNYYLKTIVKADGKTSKTETFYREGVGKSVTNDGVYTWVDGERAYMVDEQNKKVYNIEISKENSPMLVSNNMYISLIPGHSKSFFERLILVRKFGK